MYIAASRLLRGGLAETDRLRTPGGTIPNCSACARPGGAVWCERHVLILGGWCTGDGFRWGILGRKLPGDSVRGLRRGLDQLSHLRPGLWHLQGCVLFALNFSIAAPIAGDLTILLVILPCAPPIHVLASDQPTQSHHKSWGARSRSAPSPCRVDAIESQTPHPCCAGLCSIPAQTYPPRHALDNS